MTAPTWGYGPDNGPLQWGKTVPDANGHHQSPINIIPSEAVFERRLADHPLVLCYSDKQCKIIQNNGHSVQITLQDLPDPIQRSRICSGPLGGNFVLKQFHFHWGSESSMGSEHAIDGKVYAAELHLVHWNADKYSTFEAAAESPEGLLVLAVFLESGGENNFLNILTKRFKDIQYSEDSADIGRDFNPRNLLPGDMTKFWSYRGSLTTPPCHESVQFIVFKEPIEVSEEQLDAFRGLFARPLTRARAATNSSPPNTCCHLVNNFRPWMPLNDRTVYSSFRKFFA